MDLKERRSAIWPGSESKADFTVPVWTQAPFLTNGGVVMSARIRIGELSRRTGCNIETIRYYERIGLLPAPVRSARRYRLYDTADLQRLSFIRRARELGFTFD